MKKSNDLQFFNAGGNEQPLVETADDLKNIAALDKRLWATLACPAKGIELDAKTLGFIDSDADGRIRHDEIAAACQWVCSVLKDASSVFDKSGKLCLPNIDAGKSEGAKILSSARCVLKSLGKESAEFLETADFDDPSKIFSPALFNADGIVTEAVAADAQTAAAIKDIAAVCGTKADRSGSEGIDEAAAAEFFAQIALRRAWLNSVPTDAAFGETAADDCAAFRAVEEKIDDFFTRAALLKFDTDALESVNPSEEELRKILVKPLSEGAAELARLPISRVTSPVLELGDNINPQWRAAVENFAATAMSRVLGEGKTELCAADWRRVKSAFGKYGNWLAEKPDIKIFTLDSARIDEIENSPEIAVNLDELFKAEAAVAEEVGNIISVEKLVRLNANLYEILTNYVNFKRFYDGENSAFQCGKLYIDRRVCSLCVRVEDAAKHSLFAPFSGIYLLYCVCKRKGENDMTIAAAVTAGDCDNLMAGRNGVFYDRNGRDWDASVTKVVVNPISVSQAFFSPYKRFSKWITEQISKRAAAADKSIGEDLASKAAVDGKKKIDVGTVAALGVAVSGLTAAFGIVMDRIFNLGVWLPLGVVGLILAISLPSMVLAAVKLRARNLAPILDANGWAVNANAKIGIPFGAKLTSVAGTKTGRKWYVLIVAVLFAVTAFFAWADFTKTPPPAADQTASSPTAISVQKK